MADQWLVIQSGFGDPRFNMAFDEALLEAATRCGKPILRFYGWNPPAASFGYFQRYNDVASWTSLPLVRRPTGGGFVPHDADWTYSIVVPPVHEWYRLRATDSYRRLHEWIRDAFGRLGIQATLATVAQKALPGRCFAGPEQFDLIAQSRKVAGAAQRRNRLGLLIQGSIQPVPQGILRPLWEQAMIDSVHSRLWTRFTPWTPDTATLERTAILVAEKYSRDEYHQRR